MDRTRTGTRMGTGRQGQACSHLACCRRRRGKTWRGNCGAGMDIKWPYLLSMHKPRTQAQLQLPQMAARLCQGLLESVKGY